MIRDIALSIGISLSRVHLFEVYIATTKYHRIYCQIRNNKEVQT